MERTPVHIKKYPEYPDNKHFLLYTQKYFFRNEKLRHLRVEQFTRYWYMAGEQEFAPYTKENTVQDPSGEDDEDGTHRNYDKFSAELPQDSHFLAAFKSVPGCKKRNPHRLGVSRIPFIECIGPQRESFYEMKLLLGLPWYCPLLPEAMEGGRQSWIFRVDFDPQDFSGKEIEPEVLHVGREPVSFEMIANELETKFCDHDLGLICECCNEEKFSGPCGNCTYATGFHWCQHYPHKVWRKGTLHAGVLDVQRVLFNLHRKQIPTEKLRERAKAYVEAGLITEEIADRIICVILAERRQEEYINDLEGGPPDEASNLNTKLNPEQLKRLLEEREAQMRQGPEDGVTDQWRVYSHIIGCIQRGEFLRLMVQASAGTGKSFLLTTVYLWCLVHKVKCKAAAPTGIAASNVEIPRTDVSATTLHNMFEFDGELKTRLDFSKLTNSKVHELLTAKVLMIDEVSMIDVDGCGGIMDVLSVIDHTRRPHANDSDPFGAIHIILFGLDVESPSRIYANIRINICSVPF